GPEPTDLPVPLPEYRHQHQQPWIRRSAAGAVARLPARHRPGRSAPRRPAANAMPCVAYAVQSAGAEAKRLAPAATTSRHAGASQLGSDRRGRTYGFRPCGFDTLVTGQRHTHAPLAIQLRLAEQTQRGI